MLTKDNDKKEVQTAAEEKLEFGEPYEKTRKHSKFDFGENLQVVPVEIEIDSLVYSLIKHKILYPQLPNSGYILSSNQQKHGGDYTHSKGYMCERCRHKWVPRDDEIPRVMSQV